MGSRRFISQVILLVASVAHADPKQDAKTHLEKGAALHAQHKWAEALAELTTAYSLDPQPDLLFALGQIEVKLGHCDQAIQYYQRYLLSGPPAGPVEATSEAINTCRKTLGLSDHPRATVPSAPPQPTSPPPPAAATPHWYADPIGGMLVGSGVITGALGIVLYRSATHDIAGAETAASYQAGLDLVDTAHTKRTFATIFGVVGAGLVGAGIARYALHEQRTETLAIAPLHGGGIVAWSGTW